MGWNSPVIWIKEPARPPARERKTSCADYRFEAFRIRIGRGESRRNRQSELPVCQSWDGKAVMLLYTVRLKIVIRRITFEVNVAFRKVR